MGDKVGPSFSHQGNTEVKEHQGPQDSTGEARESSAAVSLVDNWESDAEVAPHRHSGDEQTAAIQRGEEEEGVDRADGWRQRPVLKQSLHSLDGEPGHKCQVGDAQVEGVNHIGCSATLRGLTHVYEQHQQVGRKAEQKGESVDKESDPILGSHMHLFSLGHGHC